MAEYIYSRVSTESQTIDPQLFTLTRMFPEARVISETASGAKHRPMLQSLLKELRDGDCLIVASLDRLGRRALDLLQLMENLEKKGVIVKSVREGIDYATITGKFVTQILASMAEMERNVIGERTKAGLAAARAKGNLGGRPPHHEAETKRDAVVLVDQGHSIRKVAKKYGLSAWYLSKLVRDSKQD